MMRKNCSIHIIIIVAILIYAPINDSLLLPTRRNIVNYKIIKNDKGFRSNSRIRIGEEVLCSNDIYQGKNRCKFSSAYFMSSVDNAYILIRKGSNVRTIDSV